jgi:hypothetical protein
MSLMNLKKQLAVLQARALPRINWEKNITELEVARRVSFVLSRAVARRGDPVALAAGQRIAKILASNRQRGA